MLATKIFHYEYLLSFYLLVEVTLLRNIPTVVTSSLFLVFLFLKFKLEGFKITFALFIIAHCVVSYLSNIYLQLITIALLYLTIGAFPVFKCPEPSGPYKVGYREFKSENNVEVSVYYPTEEKTIDDLVHIDNTLTKRNHEGAQLFFNIYIPYVVPRIVHEIAFSFFWKVYLGVNKNARIVTLNNGEKFPVIVFSHGIACSRNLYTIFTKEWASKGYIVFCIDHDEDIYCNWRYFEDLVNAKKPLLQARIKSVENVLDKIENENALEDLFGSEVPVDHERIFMAGHSFGGGTAATIAHFDKRITAGLLLLDPFLCPCDETLLKNKTELPILCIRTEEYDHIKDIRDVALEYVRKNEGNIISGHFKNSYHCTQSDLILYLGQELVLWEMNGELKNMEPLIAYHRKTINMFLDGVNSMKQNCALSIKEATKELRNEMDQFWKTIPEKHLAFEPDN